MLSWLGSWLFTDADEVERAKVKEELERLRAADQRYGEVDLNRPAHLYKNAYDSVSHNVLLTIVDAEAWESAMGLYSESEQKPVPLYNMETASAFLKAQYFTREKIDKICADNARAPSSQRAAQPVAREPSIMFVYFYRYNQEVEEAQESNIAWLPEITFRSGAGTTLQRAIDKRRDLHVAFPVRIDLTSGKICFPSAYGVMSAFVKCATQYGIKWKQSNWRFESDD